MVIKNVDLDTFHIVLYNCVCHSIIYYKKDIKQNDTKTKKTGKGDNKIKDNIQLEIGTVLLVIMLSLM